MLRLNIEDMRKLGLFILFLFLSTSVINAQEKLITEGEVVYDVTLDPPDNGEGLTQYKGTYKILVKGNAVRKELVLDNGFKDVNIYNADNKTAFSLRSMGGKNYAIELDMKDLESENDKWKGFKIDDNNGTLEILNQKAQKATVIYKDGNTCDIYYSKSWRPNDIMFNYFPGIEVMPLSFALSSTKSMNMYFKIRSINIKAIETAQFRIPKEYKIVTKDEYRQMR